MGGRISMGWAGSLPSKSYKMPQAKINRNPTIDIIISKQDVIYSDDIDLIILTRVETAQGKVYWFEKDRQFNEHPVEELEQLFKVQSRESKLKVLLAEE